MNRQNVVRRAVFSDDRVYRYRLDQDWSGFDSGKRLLLVMLNPSVADERKDDATLRRCQDFAFTWGCSGLTVFNLFAYRSTDPRGLMDVADPVGPENDKYIAEAFDGDLSESLVLFAWGSWSSGYQTLLRQRVERVTSLLAGRATPAVFGFTKDGHPMHPLHQRKDATLIAWSEGVH